MIKSSKFTNKLINEKSPYLLQHAHNPVNWFPWSSEAFETAKKENKPIFLSIGYSTCHWCHVMEHESFEDEEVAKLLNEYFVCIKVDREERPDIDRIYMSVCQMLVGSGGWPLTVIMTPDQKPFFAGTYFPKNQRNKRVGMMELLPQINEAWKNKNKEVYESADSISSHLVSHFKINTVQNISSEVLANAFNFFLSTFDQTNGGFGTRPKFPSPHNLSFLLRYHSSNKNEDALTLVEKTLTKMRLGGIYDHVGFGFHRYSTDENWFLPHFEKMLYDQAMLIIAFTEAYQVTNNKIFKQTVEEIISYTLRDMTDSKGGFFSAEDADSEGEEGKFYLWKKSEILELLEENDAQLFCAVFNIDKSGNYYEEATGHKTGTNIPHLTETIKELSNELEIDEELLSQRIEQIRKILFDVRKKRIHPYKDDKVLTDWNGLMIAALSKAGKVFNCDNYTEAAKKSLSFIFNKLIDKNGNLLHRYRDGEAGINAQLDDYAFLIWGLLELYETSFEIFYLKKAIELSNYVIQNFWDEENDSGFYSTSPQNSNLIARPKEFYDGAIPSGNSVMYSNLLKLNKLTADPKFLEYADKLLFAFNHFLEQTSTGFSQFLCGLDFSLNDSYEIIITGNKESEKTKEILEAINNKFIPNKIIMLIDEKDRDEIAKISPFTKSYTTLNNETTVYVCKNYKCSLPTTDVEKVLQLLD